MSHTAGPWHYLAPVGSGSFLIHAFDAHWTRGMINIARVPHTIYGGEGGWPEHCERHHNAVLICAAPEMHAALETIQRSSAWELLSSEARHVVTEALVKAKPRDRFT